MYSVLNVFFIYDTLNLTFFTLHYITYKGRHLLSHSGHLDHGPQSERINGHDEIHPDDLLTDLTDDPLTVRLLVGAGHISCGFWSYLVPVWSVQVAASDSDLAARPLH